VYHWLHDLHCRVSIVRRAAISRLRRSLVFNGADVVDAMNDQNPKKGKAGRLGNDRPSFGARLGVGLSKPWGVWEGASMSGLGKPPAG
jgi:hypothetical protein